MSERISHETEVEQSARINVTPVNAEVLERIDAQYRSLIVGLEATSRDMDKAEQARSAELAKLRTREAELLEEQEKAKPIREALKVQIEQLREWQQASLAQAALEATVHVSTEEERTQVREAEQPKSHLRAVPSPSEISDDKSDEDDWLSGIVRTVESRTMKVVEDDSESRVEDEVDIEELLARDLTRSMSKKRIFGLRGR